MMITRNPSQEKKSTMCLYQEQFITDMNASLSKIIILTGLCYTADEVSTLQLSKQKQFILFLARLQIYALLNNKNNIYMILAFKLEFKTKFDNGKNMHYQNFGLYRLFSFKKSGQRIT